MPMFHYEATDSSGKTLVGSMSAADEGSVRARLIQNGYTPLLVEVPIGTSKAGPSAFVPPAASMPGSSSYTSAVRGQGARVGHRPAAMVPNRELGQFYRQAASMLGSGVPLPQAMAQLVAYSRNRFLRIAVEDMEATVGRGHPLSEAMERHPRAFTAGHIGVVKSGESGGFLARALLELANQTEADAGVQTSARFNPLLLLIKFVGIPFLVAWIVFMAAIGVWSADSSRINAYLIRGVIAGFSTVLVLAFGLPLASYLLRLSPFGRMLGGIAYAVPGIGTQKRRVDRVKTLGSLSSALAAGVPVSLAWQLASEAAESDRFQREMARELPGIVRGGSVADAMGRTRLFSDQILQMAHTGELSGNLPEMLQQATVFEREEARHIASLMPWVIAVGLYLVFILVMAVLFVLYGARVYGGVGDGNTM